MRPPTKGRRLSMADPAEQRGGWLANAANAALAAVTYFVPYTAFVLVVSGLVLDLGAGEARGEADAKPKRPKGYDRLARDITKAIRKTVELEASGASLSEIRKSGDPVKGYYRELLTKYDSDRRVNADPSFVSLTDVFRELGSFYRANGPNSRLTEPVRDSVLTKLQAIDEALE